MDKIADRLQRLCAEIAAAAQSCGRNPNEIKLIAVSKQQGPEHIRDALRAGQRHFGENYVQEWRAKALELPSPEICWHFIGHLQGNKVKDVAGRVALLHTLDRVELANKIEAACAGLNVLQDCLIEVKLASEPTKYGCAAEAVMELVKTVRGLEHIRVLGLMTVGSLTADASRVQPEFSRLRGLRDAINAAKIYPRPLTELSMGMSGDFKIAIAEGATMVRVGTRIFGERQKGLG